MANSVPAGSDGVPRPLPGPLSDAEADLERIDSLGLVNVPVGVYTLARAIDVGGSSTNDGRSVAETRDAVTGASTLGR